MRTKQPIRAFRQIKGVLHVSGRMVLIQVEGCEIVPVVLNLRPFSYGETHALEDRHDAVAHEGYGMATAGRQRVARKRGVDPVGTATANDQFLREGAKLAFRKLFECVHDLAEFALPVAGYALHLSHEGFHDALRSQKTDPEIFQCIRVGRVEGFNFVLKGPDLSQYFIHYTKIMHPYVPFEGRFRQTMVQLNLMF